MEEHSPEKENIFHFEKRGTPMCTLVVQDERENMAFFL
jgi:hypothetical protein